MACDGVAEAAAAGLDPATSRRWSATVAEDLAGGVDVTSAATVPEQQRATATSSPERPGWSPGCRCAEVVSTSSPAATRPWRWLRADGDAGRARRRAADASSGPTRDLLTAERTALNLLCHLSGIATATPAWVDALAGHRRPGARHPQDDAGAARAGEVRRALRRRRQPPDGAVGRGAGQGQPRRRGRRGGARRSRPSAPMWPGPARRGRGRHPRPARRGARRRRRPGPAGQLLAGPDCARPYAELARRPRPGWRRRGGLTLDRRPQRSRRPASTTSPSARSPTLPRCSTSALDLRPIEPIRGGPDDAARHRRRQHQHRARALRR